MSSLDERRAGFKRYKEDVKKRGKPFYPFAMFEDTVMSLVVVLVIAGLAVVWKNYRHPRAADRAEGRPRDDLVRPAARLVLLLPLLPAADLQVAGDGDPRHDRDPDALPRPAARAAVRRPAHGAAALAPPGRDRGRGAGDPLDGRPHLQGRGREGADRERGRRRRSRAGRRSRASQNNKEALAGANLFAESGCTNCHTYLGSGGSNLGAPDLSAEGAKGKGIQFQIDHLKCPSCVNPGSPMPPFAALGEDNLHKLAVFLEASKGPK